MSTSTMPDGRVIHLQPPAIDLDGPAHFAFPPRYGEHTHAVLREAGLGDAECAALATQGIVSLGAAD
jgi:crotonobetainyl-CoA:carnitine CoA-transferase CaiB-like acyl-CoA transferase